MPDIVKPMRIPGLNLSPPLTGKVRLSEDMQQCLSLLTGYYDNQRVLIRATESGVLQTVQPAIKDIEVFAAADPKFSWVGGDIPCTDVAVIAGTANSGLVWIRPYSIASAANGWPLAKGEVFGFTIRNLNQLHVTIETTGEIAVIAYTR
ncbi:unnamed protein product [marine sediment metagenome]|uniref:Uncharacterized protein n=1 Tax=marine sediment metagenome TaxID=412755 RepID=X1RXL8_9ZZZZ